MTLTITSATSTNYNVASKTYAATIELGYRCSEGTLTYDATKGYICTKAGIYTSCYSYISQTCNNYSENEAGRRACNESIPNTCDSHCYTYDDGKTRYTRCDDGYMSCVGDHTRAVNACYSRYLDRQWDCSYCVGGYTCDSNWIHYSGSYGSSNLVCYKLATS